MAKRSAGILLYRRGGKDALEVLLVHPGGPLWTKRDAGAWSIPKGEYEANEEPRAAALREFAEELGSAPPSEELIDLGSITQRSGKVLTAFAVEGDLDPAALRSNTFEMEWPPRSGRTAAFPEVDRAEWLAPDQAREKINPAQAELIDRLLSAVTASGR